MKIKNYTSSVPVQKTISRIVEILAESGAKAIGQNFEGGRLSSVTFQMPMNGKDVLVRLPAKPVAVFDMLRKDCKKPRPGTIQRLHDQAHRTAWKIQQDWLEVELTNIRLNQKEPLQVFLAYVWDGSQTYYDFLKGSNFKALPAPSNV